MKKVEELTIIEIKAIMFDISREIQVKQNQFTYLDKVLTERLELEQKAEMQEKGKP